VYFICDCGTASGIGNRNYNSSGCYSFIGSATNPVSGVIIVAEAVGVKRAVIVVMSSAAVPVAVALIMAVALGLHLQYLFT
jgi:hypothetical protein